MRKYPFIYSPSVPAGYQQYIGLPKVRFAQVFLKKITAPDRGTYVAYDAKTQVQLLTEMKVIVCMWTDVTDDPVNPG